MKRMRKRLVQHQNLRGKPLWKSLPNRSKRRRKASTGLKLWAFAKISLKITERDFWGLVWVEFQALSDALGDEDEKTE